MGQADDIPSHKLAERITPTFPSGGRSATLGVPAGGAPASSPGAPLNGHGPASGHAQIALAPPAPARRLRTFQTIVDVPVFRWYLLSMVGNFSAMQMQMISRGYLT